MATAGKTTKIPINSDLFKAAFEKRGLVRDRVAADIGCGCEISNAISRGQISKPIMAVLTYEYGIPYEEVAPYSKTSTNEKNTQPDEIIIAPQISEEQWTRLGDLIKQSITEALKEI